MDPGAYRGVAQGALGNSQILCGQGISLLLEHADSGLSGPIPGESTQVHVYDYERAQRQVLIEDVERFAGSSMDRSYSTKARAHLYGIIDAKPPDQPKKLVRALCRLEACARIDPPAGVETNLQTKSGRQERDFFYEKSMNGVIGKRCATKYAALLLTLPTAQPHHILGR